MPESFTTDSEPELAVAVHFAEFLHLQRAAMTLLNNPRQRMFYHPGRVRLVACADPAIAAVIVLRRVGRQVRR